MDLVYDQEELPFMWLREEKKDGLAFIVLEPGGIIPNYSVEIADGDVEVLGITGPEDTMIVNIVTLPADQSGKNFPQPSRSDHSEPLDLGGKAVHY